MIRRFSLQLKHSLCGWFAHKLSVLVCKQVDMQLNTGIVLFYSRINLCKFYNLEHFSQLSLNGTLSVNVD